MGEIPDSHAVRCLYAEYPWFTPQGLEKKWIVTNPDLDGLLSLALISRICPTCKFAGFYTGDRLILTPQALSDTQNEGFASFVAVECDLYLMPSVGHHFTLATSRFPHLNPNILRGYTVPAMFTRKFPLNMLTFLWRWFQQPIPSSDDPARADFLRFLFYADGVLLKVVQQYERNCADWLQWLDFGVTISELKALISSGRTVQLARCLYKNFGNTQIGFGFTTQRDELTITDLPHMQVWIDEFCQRLDLPGVRIPPCYRLFRQFVQHRVQFNPNSADLVDGTIVSDALVRMREWSVTLPAYDAELSTVAGLPTGLSAEPSKWVRRYNLDGPCVEGISVCRRCTI